MSNGHTSGLGSGFIAVVAVIVGALALLAAIAFGIGTLLHSTPLTVFLGFAVPGAAAFWLRKSVRDGFLNGLSGAAASLAASLMFRMVGGFTGAIIAIVVSIIAYVVVLFYAAKYIPKKTVKK